MITICHGITRSQGGNIQDFDMVDVYLYPIRNMQKYFNIARRGLVFNLAQHLLPASPTG